MRELDDWRSRVVSQVAKNVPGVYVERGHGVLAVRVRNLTDRFLTGTEVEVRLEGVAATASHRKPRLRDVPDPPRDYGTHSLFGAAWAGMPGAAILSPLVAAGQHVARRDTWAEKGMPAFTFEVGDLRPRAVSTGDDVYLFLTERPSDGCVHGTWTATFRGIDGVLSGAVDLPVLDDPVDIESLLTADRSK